MDYATADGTALAGQDYITASGTLPFAPGILAQTFTVGILADSILEGEETLLLSLADPIQATLSMPFSVSLTIVESNHYLYLPLIRR